MQERADTAAKLFSNKFSGWPVYSVIHLKCLHASFCHENGSHFGAQPQ